MITFLGFVAIFLLMLVSGVFWGPWFALSRSLSVFSAAEFIKIAKTMSANLGAPMRFLLPLCIIAMLLTVWCYPQKQTIGFYTGVIAVILIVTSLIITMAIEVPIVKNIEQWTVENLPTDWIAIRDRWIKFHVLRTITSLGSFACFVFTIMYLR